MNNKQQGFTLIELVVVIVILGILAATALPKFMDLQRDAHISALQGMAGAIKSAVSIVNDKAIIMGKETQATACVFAYTTGIYDSCTISDATQKLNDAIYLAYGKPSASKYGIIRSIVEEIKEYNANGSNDSDFVFSMSANAGEIKIWETDRPEVKDDGSEGCGIIYTEATDAYKLPIIELITVSC